MVIASPHTDVTVPKQSLTPFVLAGTDERGDNPAIVDGRHVVGPAWRGRRRLGNGPSTVRGARLRAVVVVVLTCVVGLAYAGTASAADGDILFKQCVSESGSGGACADGHLLGTVWDAAVSPDGRHAYVSTYTTGALHVFDRDPATGRISQRTGTANCYNNTPNAGDCTEVHAMSKPLDVLVSPNGKWVYVAAWGSKGITVFDRDPSTGRLTQKPGAAGCLGAMAGCEPGRALSAVRNLFPSADFKNIYALAQTGGGAIAILTVDGSNGELGQLNDIDGCVTDSGDDGQGNACANGTAIGQSYQFAVSPDGRHAYGASIGHDAITLFIRDEVTGGLTQRNGTAGCIAHDGLPDGDGTARCQTQAQLANPGAMRMTPDGKFVYALGNRFLNGSIVVFERASNGLLTFRSCVNEAGDGGCADARGVSKLQAGSITPDGTALAAKNLASGGTGGLSFFDIDPATGALSQRPRAAGCATNDGTTQSGGGLAGGCTALPNRLGSEGNVEFVSNTLLNYGSFQSGSAVVFDRDFRPTCDNIGASVPHNTSVPIGFSCRDINNDPITYEITQAPSAGTLGALDQANARVLYNPFLGFSGADSFRYRGVARGFSSEPRSVDVSVAGPLPSPGGGTPPPPPVGGGGGGPVLQPDPERIIVIFGFAFSKSTKKFTKFTTLQIKALPVQATLKVTCKAPKGKKCPAKSLTKHNAFGNVNLKKWMNKKLAAGTKLTVTVTKPGNFIGAVKTLTVRKKKAPSITTRCLAPGASAAVSC